MKHRTLLSGVGIGNVIVWLGLVGPLLAQTDYAKLGIPDPTRVWKVSEYQGVFDVLRRLPPADLPRRGASSGVYERMSSLDNLKGLHNPSVPILERVKEAMSAECLFPLTSLYVSQAHKNKVLQDEAIGMINFMMKLSSDMFVVMDEFEAAQPAERKASPGNVEGKQGQVHEWEEAILGLMGMPGEREVWAPAQRIEIIRILQRSVTETKPLLTPRFSKEAEEMLAKHLREEPDNSVKEGLTKLQQSLPTF